ncbi:DUF3027 domain-containing protein [Paeniglutamicibacter gangotriensis]|uniref:DUF3027 domain-containing protein n=1 Tax=Paeniglutamicibacter gangotriensis TaxID=254787 RepID=A0A5B0EP16_9MICC|nr:DUF3027 domain-containing protein [Paeniglutamicibacter gangotriensis]KAA0979019.1 DUF3027 domain-containing protein [Paeniglutamicibacter gangotriensis]
MARKPILDATLAKAIEPARSALLEITDASMIGEHVDALNDGERLVTHRFASLLPGYEGWCWFATLTRVPRGQAKDLTVCEVGILPGDDALLAPAWVPWAERVRPEEIDAERRVAEEAAAAAAGIELPVENAAQEPSATDAADAEADPESEVEAEGAEDSDKQ